jgi:DNA polymerase III alpha subunit
MTQYDAEALSRLGLTKVDLLGNHALDELDRAFALWRAEGGSGASAPASLDAIPLEDAPTFEMIGSAQTIGCFQLESPAMRAVLARLPVSDLSDVTHALAIVRPGPASGRAKELFLMRARGEVSEPVLHAAFRERLEATHGVLLYEEDILFVLSTLSGIPLSAAEALRVRLGERSADPVWLDRARVRLVRRATARGFSPETAEDLWSDVVRFVQYSFNKAHATSQALLAYQTAYLRRHAPVEHACAVLDHHGGLYPRRVIAADLSRRGILLLPPCVLRSSLECAIEGCGGEGPARGIRIGLRLLSGLQGTTRERLLRSRAVAGPFSGAEDLIHRARPSGRELRALVLSGACDALLALTAADYPWVHQALAQCLETGEGARAENIIREARQRTPREPREMVARYGALSRVKNELEYLGMHLSGHPLGVLRSEARRQGCVPSHALAEHVGREVSFAGVVAAARSIPSGAMQVFQYLTLEDEHGLVEARLAPEAYSRLHAQLTTPGPFLVRALVQEQQGVLSLMVHDLLPFHQRPGA